VDLAASGLAGRRVTAFLESKLTRIRSDVDQIRSDISRMECALRDLERRMDAADRAAQAESDNRMCRNAEIQATILSLIVLIGWIVLR
jgi:hypothetical protein